jgi:hypothetical protein
MLIGFKKQLRVRGSHFAVLMLASKLVSLRIDTFHLLSPICQEKQQSFSFLTIFYDVPSLLLSEYSIKKIKNNQ